MAFGAEAVLFGVVLGGLGLALRARVKRLRFEVERLQGALPASPVLVQRARLSAARSPADRSAR